MNARLLTFDRGDYRIMRLIMVLAAIGLPLGILGLPAYDLFAGNPLSVALPASNLAPVAVAEGVTVGPAGSVLVEVAGAPLGVWAVSLVPGLVVLAAAAVVLVLLWRVVAAAAAGAPFTVDTVHCLRGISLAVLLGGAAHMVVAGFVDAALSRRFLPGEEAVLFVRTSDGGVLFVFAGCMLIAMIAEVFARGVVLEDQLEGVV